MLINQETDQKHIKPRHRRMISAAKKRNSQLKVAFHSCGAIATVIPDLIEIGVDVLNPIQPLATGMDLSVLKKEYGKDFVFFCGLDVQNVLQHGSAPDVENEVKLRISQAGRGGGFVLAPAQNIQPDTPLENVFALFEAAEKYGRYA